MCYSLFDFSLVLLLRVVVVVVVVIVVRFFLSCACRRVPVSRDARSGFKDAKQQHTTDEFFSVAAHFFFFKQAYEIKNSPPFFFG